MKDLKLKLFSEFIKCCKIENGKSQLELYEDANEEMSLVLWTQNNFEMEIQIDYSPICTEIKDYDLNDLAFYEFEFLHFEVEKITFSILGEEIDFSKLKAANKIVMEFLKNNIEI